jgi:transcriptional regulator with GAF, ATPase, and Fis domain
MTVGLAEGYAWSVGSLNITPIGYVLVTLISVSIALMVHRRLKNNGELRLASRALGGGAEERIVAAAVDEVARIVTSTLEIREVYREFGNELSKLVDCDRLAIMTVDQDAGTMEFKYVYGEPSSRHYEGEVVCMENTRTKAVVETGQTHVWTDSNDEPHFRINDAPPDPELKAGITTPLVSNGRIVGVMNLRSGRAGAYGPRNRRS